MKKAQVLWPSIRTSETTFRPLMIGDLVTTRNPRYLRTIGTRIEDKTLILVIGTSEPDNDGDVWPIVYVPSLGITGRMWLYDNAIDYVAG